MNEEDRAIIMAEMGGSWQENQTTESSNNQETVNIYVTMILQLILTNPWISTPQILAQLVGLNWMGSETHILNRFGGWRTFARTIDRMETLRAGVLNERMNGFPITTAPLMDGTFGAWIPEPDGFIAWWAPQIEGGGPPFLFKIVRAGDGAIHRYPHQGTYTADNSEEEPSDVETYPADS